MGPEVEKTPVWNKGHLGNRERHKEKRNMVSVVCVP